MGHPSTPGGKERLPQHKRANTRGEAGHIAQADHIGPLPLPMLVCMQGDRLEN